MSEKERALTDWEYATGFPIIRVSACSICGQVKAGKKLSAHRYLLLSSYVLAKLLENLVNDIVIISYPLLRNIPPTKRARERKHFSGGFEVQMVRVNCMA